MTGREGASGTNGQPIIPGDEVCVYGLDGGGLSLTIHREADPRTYYEGTVDALEEPVAVPGLGLDATYGNGPFGLFENDDAIAVLANGVTFTLHANAPPPFGPDALRTLAEIVLARLAPSTGPRPLTDEFMTGAATVLIGGDAFAEWVDLPFALDLQDQPGGGFPSIVWNNQPDITAQIELIFAEWHATGALSSDDDTLGIYLTMNVELQGIDDHLSVVRGLDIGGGVNPGEGCTAQVDPTPTGGIVGTFDCPNVSDFEDLVITASGTFWAEPGEVTVPVPTDGTPGGDAFTVGRASLDAGGDFAGHIELAGLNDTTIAPQPDGPVYPALAWSSDGTSDLFYLWFPERHAAGTFSTADKTLGVSYLLTVTEPAGGERAYAGGFGLGFDAGFDAPAPCVATVVSTPTGGIAGTVRCTDLVDGAGVFALDGTFSAEFGIDIGS